MNNLAGPRSPRMTIAQREAARADAIIEQELDALGYTVRAILQRLGELSSATKTLVASKDGEFTDEIQVPDNPTSLGAVGMLLQLRRAFPSTKVEVSGAVRMEQLQELVVRLEALPPERLDQLIEADGATRMLPEAQNVEVRDPELP